MEHVSVNSYKDLLVWQKSFDLCIRIYQFSIQLPREEEYGLKSQMRRCSVSIPSNIAEGSRRSTRKDYSSFLRAAFGSISELETQMLVVQKVYNIEDSEIMSLIVEISKMLYAMITKLSDTSL